VKQESLSDTPISVVEAARTLFRSATPSDDQILRVCRLLRAGALRPKQRAGSPLEWTTTPAALADFMASSVVQRAQRSEPLDRSLLAHSEDVPIQPEGMPCSGAAANDWPELSGVYREIWRDYFLAMLLRRRTDRYGTTFKRAVVLGQAVALLAIVSLFVTALTGMRALYVPSERAAILHMIDKTTDEFAVTQWHTAVPAPQGDAELIRVEYRYRNGSKRWIHTDRTFLVTEDTVFELESDEVPLPE